MNANIDFNTINHGALTDSFSRLTTSHKPTLPAQDTMAESQRKQETSKEIEIVVRFVSLAVLSLVQSLV